MCMKFWSASSFWYLCVWLHNLEPCHSRCGPWAGSISITWGFIKNANSKVPTQTWILSCISPGDCYGRWGLRCTDLKGDDQKSVCLWRFDSSGHWMKQGSSYPIQEFIYNAPRACKLYAPNKCVLIIIICYIEPITFTIGTSTQKTKKMPISS